MSKLPEGIVVIIAASCHELNRQFCMAMGDDSQVEWTNAPKWQRDSAVNGVKFHLENPLASPSNSHEEWLKEKEATGWKYGPVKDEVKKEHPCFVPYEQLPPEQKAKDYLFKTNIHNMASMYEHLTMPMIAKTNLYPVSEYFAFSHLPEKLQEVSKPMALIAWQMADNLPSGPETAAGLRKLLEAKDCFVRAALDK